MNYITTENIIILKQETSAHYTLTKNSVMCL